MATEAALLYDAGPVTSAQGRTHDIPTPWLNRSWQCAVRLSAIAWLLVLCPGHASAQSRGRTPAQLKESAVAADEAARATAADSCVAAHERALERLDAHDWLAARNRLERCAEVFCPAVVRDECAKQLGRLVPRIPRIVLAARDQAGQDLVDVRVYANGVLLLPELGAESVPLNPGRYRFEFVGPGGVKATRDVLVREGEVKRRIDVVFSPPTAQPAAPPPPPTPDTIWTPPVTISAVVAATGLAFFGFFAINGKSVESCRPNCTGSEVDRLRRDYLVADISLGVALLAAGVGTYLVYHQPRSSPTVSARLNARPDGGFLSAELRAW